MSRTSLRALITMSTCSASKKIGTGAIRRILVVYRAITTPSCSARMDRDTPAHGSGWVLRMPMNFIKNTGRAVQSFEMSQ